MKKSVLDLRSLIVVPALFLICYLISLPVYYFGLTWEGGRYTFYIENIYISVFGLTGFFGFKRIDRFCGDDGTGDLYLCSTLIILFVILLGFAGRDVYACTIARIFYPGGLKYKSALSFDEGLTLGSLTDLMKFSSVYVCTYAAVFCLSFFMFWRALCNQRIPVYIDGWKRWRLKRKGGDPREQASADADGGAGEDESGGAGKNADVNDWPEKWFDEDDATVIRGRIGGKPKNAV